MNPVRPRDKKELRFDPISRRKYLAGFKSRKKLRKKAAQRQKSEREKRFQKEVKQEKKLKIKAKLKEYGFEDDTVSSESAGGASTFDQVYSSHIVAVDANPNLGQSTARGHTVHESSIQEKNKIKKK